MRVLWLGALDSWCLSLNRPKIVGEMGSFESSEMEIGACSPLADPNASPGYRRRLVKALTAAAVRRALERALGEDLGKGRA